MFLLGNLFNSNIYMLYPYFVSLLYKSNYSKLLPITAVNLFLDTIAASYIHSIITIALLFSFLQLQ